MNAERLVARAALFAAPDTLVSVVEVAWVLCLAEGIDRKSVV